MAAHHFYFMGWLCELKLSHVLKEAWSEPSTEVDQMYSSWNIHGRRHIIDAINHTCISSQQTQSQPHFTFNRYFDV